MQKYLPFFIGLGMVLAGSLLGWLDIGSPDTANIVRAIGLGLIIFNLLRTRGGG